MSIPPFVKIRGKPYLVVNYDLGGPVLDPTPCLPALLQHHRPTDILLLRPLSPDEATLLHQATRDAEVEGWARIVVNDEDRVRARKDRPT